MPAVTSTGNSSVKMVSEVRSNDVFISYSRRDKEFVQQLDGAFRKLSRDPWIDWNDIQPSEDWWQAIEAGIEAAETFVFVMSPDSVISQVCRQEVEHAVNHNKRLLPVVRREGFAIQDVHPSLSRHNWLFFRETDDFNQAFQLLIKALDTDLGHVRAHTRLLVRAIEWDKKDRNDSFLLRGTDLEEAEDWLNQSTGKQPEPSQLQKEYIAGSRKAETARQKAEIRQQRMFIAGIGVFTLLSVAAAVAAFIQWQAADRLSNENKILAEKNMLLLNLPNPYEAILEERVNFLRTKIRDAARAGRSARALQSEIHRSESISPVRYAELKKAARNLMNEWLQAKQEIFAPPFNTRRLEELTTGARLERARLAVHWLQVNNAYFKYGQPKIFDFRIISVNGDQMVCEAKETEDVTFYPNPRQSPMEQGGTRRTRYIMKKEDGRWKISDAQTISHD